MILYACIVRLQDGLPLSASTDFYPSRQLLECKRWVRRLSPSLSERPARGTAHTCDHHIHFLSIGAVSSLAVCSGALSSAAAFRFLEELSWEFSSSYSGAAISLASRPFAFLEFDSVIQRVKHNYNSAGPSLPSRPAHLDAGPAPVCVKLEDLREANGIANGHAAPPVPSGGRGGRMSPVGPLGILSLTLSIMCAALSLIRATHLAEHSFQEGYGNAGGVAAFLVAFFAGLSQCYLYVFYSPARTLKAVGLFLVVGACNGYLYGLRNLWQILFHVLVALLSLQQTVSRRPVNRHSDGRV